MTKNREERPAVNLAVVGNNGLGERVASSHHDVATMLASNGEAPLFQGADEVGAGEPVEAGSYRQKQGLEALGWHRETIVLKGKDVTLNCLADVGDGRLSALTLRHAARQTRARSEDIGRT